ncbi:MAG: type II toxin-antitoxin system RelE/ParE family toxin [Bacteroidales bacterium]|nr:type II toxin-antitoxin system RelE/ParE family toxin [Bacteroidales bacterium]
MNVKIIYLTDAQYFISSLSDKVRRKILFNADLVIGGVKDTRLFKKLEGSEIWELRTEYGGNEYRLFSFWDTRNETLIVATHGIAKKTQKTPRKEIAKAEQIRNQYFKK